MESAEQYLVFNRLTDTYIFDTVYHTAAAKRITEEITRHNGKVNIIFTRTTNLTDILRKDGLQIETLPRIWGHSELWFGTNIARMVINTWGVVMLPLRIKSSNLDVVTLPFNSVTKAFEIACNICRQTFLREIGYDIQLLAVSHHLLAQLLGMKEEHAENNNDDYNPSDPASWTQGVFCSQVVLLFLKECVNQNAISIPDEHKRLRFMSVYSKTCLPRDLKRLLQETWG